MAPGFTWRTIAKGHLLLAVPDPSRKVITARHPTKFRYNERLNTPSTFQQAVVRNLNDKNAQLQKQLDNVLREGRRLFSTPERI
jgi:predicted alpha/beta hydrolase family esterase